MDYAAKCRLIRLVEEEEPIWNTGIEDYTRIDKKTASWNRVYKEMIASGFNGGSRPVLSSGFSQKTRAAVVLKSSFPLLPVVVYLNVCSFVV